MCIIHDLLPGKRKFNISSLVDLLKKETTTGTPNNTISHSVTYLLLLVLLHLLPLLIRLLVLLLLCLCGRSPSPTAAVQLTPKNHLTVTLLDLFRLSTSSASFSSTSSASFSSTSSSSSSSSSSSTSFPCSSCSTARSISFLCREVFSGPREGNMTVYPTTFAVSSTGKYSSSLVSFHVRSCHGSISLSMQKGPSVSPLSLSHIRSAQLSRIPL